MNDKIKPTHAQILFDCDRVCCICHDRTRKHVQVHHIDEDHENDVYGNLGVLCLECHNDTMLRGGFGRKLSPTQVKMYRDDWVAQVRSSRRSVKGPAVRHRPPLVLDSSEATSKAFLAQLYEARLLPQGVNYEFVAFSFTMHGMVHVITDCDDINPKNAFDREGILAAYVLCTLGAILPQGMVWTDTPSPDTYSEPVLGHTPVRNGPTIRVPRWFVRGAEDIGVFNVTVDYETLTNQVFLFFHPYVTLPRRFDRTQGNYDVLEGKLVEIAQAFVGNSLSL